MATIPVGSGLATQVVVKDETTYGVAPSLTSGVDSFEILSETLELKKTAVQGEGLAAGHVYRRTKRRVLTNYDVSGDIKMEVPTRNLGFFLRYMIGDFAEVPTALGGGIYKTVFQPKSSMTGHSFTLQKGVPAVDATVEPFTEVGLKITGWDLSVATGAIAQMTLTMDGRNELGGAGNSDPLNGSIPPLASFLTAQTGRGLEMFHFRQATLFSGGTPTYTPIAAPSAPTLSTNAAGGTILAGTYTVKVTYTAAYGETIASVSTQQVTTGSTSTLTITSPASVGGATGWYAYVSQAGGNVLTRQQVAGSPTAIGTNLVLTAPPTSTGLVAPAVDTTGIVSLTGSTPLANVKDAKIAQTMAYDVSRMFIGNNGFKAEQIEQGYRAPTGTATIEWQSNESIYNAYSADTTTSLELTFTGPTVGGQTYLLDLILPNIKFDGESPKVAGQQVVTQAVPFTVLDDETTVPIQVIYQSEDSTF